MPLTSHRPEVQIALEQLRSQPSVAVALEADDGTALYRALLGLERRAQGSEREAVRVVLGDRRLFATPVAKAPAMFTLNGVGTMLNGKAERDPEAGTYIATLYFTFFFVPLWPIAAYLCAPGEKSGSHYFLARVPLARGGQRMRRVVGAAATLAAAVLAWFAVESAGHADVWVVNGLARPVVVELGAERVELPPLGRAVRRLEEGPVHVRAQLDDRVIDELDEVVPGGVDVVVYNVAGLAPVALVPVVYQAKAGAGGATPPLDHLGGRRWVVQDGVGYVFEDAPETMSLSKGQQRRIEWQLQQGDGDYAQTEELLLAADGPARAFEVGARGALIEGACERAAHAVMALVRLGDVDHARGMLDALVPDSSACLDAHHAAHAIARMTGGLDLAQGVYRPADPSGGPDAAAETDYLAARVRDELYTADGVRALLARYPDYPPLVAAHRARLLEDGAYAAFVEQLGAVPAEGEGAELAIERARALWSLGKRTDALAGLTAWARTASAAGALDAAVHGLYVEMARATAGADVALFRGAVAGIERAWVDAVGGVEPDPADLDDAPAPWALVCSVELAAQHDPAAAARVLALRKATPLFVRRTTVALLALEAIRAGGAGAASARAWLDGATLDPRVSDALVTAATTGERGARWPWAPASLRAAALVVRARAAELSTAERAKLVVEAEALEGVPGVVHAAAVAWPGPA